MPYWELPRDRGGPVGPHALWLGAVSVPTRGLLGRARGRCPECGGEYSTRKRPCRGQGAERSSPSGVRHAVEAAVLFPPVAI